jgi:hypothetical protein
MAIFCCRVSFSDRGYVASSPELPVDVTALSLSDLRKRIAALAPDIVEVKFTLDRAAERERNGRRSRQQLTGGPRVAQRRASTAKASQPARWLPS